jgi:hypothetical protein
VAALAGFAPKSSRAQPATSPADAFSSEEPTTEVVVQGRRRKRDATEVSVDAAQARRVAGTEGDPTKVVEDLPGIARPSFSSGELIVWGSAPSDTRIYVDGVEIPRLFHGSGLRSTINGNLVRDIALTPGAYGVDHGRGLGGIVQIETEDRPVLGVHGYAAADPIDGSAMLRVAPTSSLRLTLAGRYGWIDRVLSATGYSDVTDFVAVPRYDDYQAKAHLELRRGESLELAYLGSHDHLTRSLPNHDPAEVRRADDTNRFDRVYLRYRRDMENGDRIEVIPWFGRDSSLKDEQFGAAPARLDEQTWRWGIRANRRFALSREVKATVGMDGAGASSDLVRQGSLSIPSREGDVSVFGQPPGDDANVDAWHADMIDVAPYATLDALLGPVLWTIGLRADAYLLETSRQTPRVGQTPSIGLSQLEGRLEPRVSARWEATTDLEVFGAAGIYSQPPAPADLSAVFGTPSLGPETAYHATLGESLKLTEDLSLEAVAFYKLLDDLAVRDPLPTPALAHVILQNGVGRSYGLQWMIRQAPWHGFFGWVSYTISRSERRDQPDGPWRPFDVDQPHVGTVVASKVFGPWTVGARFRYARGLPRTPVVGAFFDAKDDAFQPIFGSQNGIRLPDYWQLDLRVDRSFALGGDWLVAVYAELLNATNHRNAEEFAYSTDYSRRGVITGLPAVAAFGIRMEF